MKIIKRFFNRYHGHFFHLWVEDYLGFFIRSLPFAEGMTIRWLVYRLLFNQLKGFSYIFPGVYFTHTYGMSVGNNFAVNTGTHFDARGGIKIGDNVMIGPYSVFVSSEHNYFVPDELMISQDHILAPVEIGDDVWIGAHVTICGGIKIGRGSVVGAGAVVVNDVAPYSIVGGVPAKLIRMRK